MKDARRFLPLKLVLLAGLMVAVWLPGWLVAPSRQKKSRKERETMKKTTLSLLLACLALLSLTACFPPGRGAKTLKETTPDRVLTFELWTDHENYDFGEPVNVRATLTNISSQVVNLRSKSGSDPVMDIIIRTAAVVEPMERLVWSSEHPDNVLYNLTLAPGESYELQWSQMPSQRRSYIVEVPWIDHTNYLSVSWLGISYGESLPNP